MIGTANADAVKADYLHLTYLQQTLCILQQNEAFIDQLIQDATAHYQVGQGMQQDVLEAQVNRTKIVREFTMHYQQMWQIQAHLKGLLNRDQQSPDIVTDDLAESPLKASLDGYAGVNLHGGGDGFYTAIAVGPRLSTELWPLYYGMQFASQFAGFELYECKVEQS